MEKAGICAICGSAGVLRTCSICGRQVCAGCLASGRGVCVQCCAGRTFGSEDGKGVGTMK